MSVAYITHYQCQRHEMGVHHPEQPARLSAINDRLIASGLDMVLHHHDAPLLEREQLLQVHDADYVEKVFNTSPEEGHVWLDGDTAMNPHSLNAALRAAGGAVHGVDLLMEKKAGQAFCAVRPPGHHAERDKGMGFCVFNNVALAARHAVKAHGLQRVAVIDFDVHHGNGTEDILSNDPNTLFFSSFQHPFYPHSGIEDVADNIINSPLPSGADGADFREMVQTQWLPRLRDYAPELIIISAGFDAHRADDMANLNFLEFDYAWITRELMAIARESAEGRVLSCLEGGYDLHALARSVEAHLKAFFD